MCFRRNKGKWESSLFLQGHLHFLIHPLAFNEPFIPKASLRTSRYLLQRLCFVTSLFPTIPTRSYLNHFLIEILITKLQWNGETGLTDSVPLNLDSAPLQTNLASYVVPTPALQVWPCHLHTTSQRRITNAPSSARCRLIMASCRVLMYRRDAKEDAHAAWTRRMRSTDKL